MTIGGSVVVAPCAWRSVLPPGHAYAALPSARTPVVIAQRDRHLLAYVRECLLAGQPGSRLPEWIFPVLRSALRLPGLWWLTPSVHPAPSMPRTAAEQSLSRWLVGRDWRVITLDHSRDPDARFVLLLFRRGQAAPSLALKVPANPDAVTRVLAESTRLRALDLQRLGDLGDTVPLELGRPDDVDAPVLMTTAQPGVPMLVTYHRHGHTRRPSAVRSDFAAAADWLHCFQARTAGRRARLELTAGTEVGAVRALTGRAAEREQVLVGLRALRDRLARHTAVQTMVHGDFWAGNILLRDAKVTGVVDWERGEPVGSPVRDLGRFAVAYSIYLDRHTRPGRPVRAHPGLVAGSAGGVDYLVNGTGWYPLLAREYVVEGLHRLALPAELWRDVLLAEVASIAAEATDEGFARDLWQAFGRLCGPA